MLPSFLTAMHAYFNKMRNMVMGLTQALTVSAIMVWPAFTTFLMDRYGFRGTVAIFAALSLNCVLAAIVLQPVEWHMRKKKLSFDEAFVSVIRKADNGEKEKEEYAKADVEEALLEISEGIQERKSSYVVRKPRPSIVSVGSLAASVGSNLNKLHQESEKERLGIW